MGKCSWEQSYKQVRESELSRGKSYTLMHLKEALARPLESSGAGMSLQGFLKLRQRVGFCVLSWTGHWMWMWSVLRDIVW